MAEKKKKQTATFQKQTNGGFQRKEVTGFQHGNTAAFPSKDSNAGKQENEKVSKGYSEKMYRETSGHNVQKSDSDAKVMNESVYVQNNDTAVKNSYADAVKEPGQKPNDTGNYNHRNMHRPSENKEKYHRKQVYKEQQSKQQTVKSKESEEFQTGNPFFTTDKPEPSQNGTDSKKHNRKLYQKTSGHNVQKSDSESKMMEESAFAENYDTFFKENASDSAGETEQKTNDTDDYHRRDTYRPSEKKGKYHKKRVQKEQQGKKQTARPKESGAFQTKETTFKENVDSEFTDSKKLQRKKKQAQRAGQKTQKAKAKLPKTKEYTLQRVYDEESGRGKYVVVPIEKEKPFKPEGLPKSAVRRLQNEGKYYVHGKIAENEKENSAVEGAHKTEQKAEELYGFVKRHHRGKEQRQRAKVARLEKKQFQKEVNFQYQKFLEENPQVKKKALQKRLQKQRIKREYLKARQKGAATKNAKEAVSKTANLATQIAKKLQEIARNHAGTLITIGVFAMLLIMIMTSISSCGAMFVNTQSTIMAGSYLSEPSEIDAADLLFTRLEMDLQNEIDNIETDYPGYDEYSYNLGAIGHNPFTLISYLSAVYTEFTASDVEEDVQALFDEMYTLTITPDTETRTRQVQSTDESGNPLYDESGNPVMEEEEYQVSVLRVVLTVKPLETIVAEKMNTEEKELYAMYSETGGLLQQFASPVDLYWYNYISSYYGYRKNPNTGNEEFHRGVDIAVPTGTTVYAAHDGTVTTATYDSYYGNYVVIEKDGYTTKYAHMNNLRVSAGQEVTKGTVIGTTGNTGSSTGSHLHIECLYDGEYYNPLFYFDVGTETIYGEGTNGADGAGGNTIPPDSYDDATVQTLMEEAARYIGYPYVWGGSSPSTSFDCSGYVCWVFTNSGVHNLPRTTAQGIYDQCTPVAAADAKAGDIIFFTGTYNSGVPVSHVGIYCGDGVMIHCGDPIGYASINSSYWQSHFYGFGRLN